jgi:ribosomal protein L21E
MTPVNLIAEACYKYQTKSSINLCIRDKLTTTKTGVCNVQEKKQVFNSGAPVKIDNFVESAVSESKLSFTFDIMHMGTGKVFKEDSWCEQEYGVEDIVHVKIDSGIGTLTCTGLNGGTEGDVRVQNGKASIRCILEIPENQRGDFEKSIVITTTYKYSNTISKQITLKHSGE